MMMDDDQDRILDEHMSVVRQQAFLMKKASMAKSWAAFSNLP